MESSQGDGLRRGFDSLWARQEFQVLTIDFGRYLFLKMFYPALIPLLAREGPDSLAFWTATLSRSYPADRFFPINSVAFMRVFRLLLLLYPTELNMVKSKQYSINLKKLTIATQYIVACIAYIFIYRTFNCISRDRS